MANDIVVGPFTCDVRLRRVGPIEFVREERDGVTYLSAKDYQLAYETILRFDDGGRLPIKAKVMGEGANMMVIRNASGEPSKMRGWVSGSVELLDEQDQAIFRGVYNDMNAVHTLSGDEALTATSSNLEHWQSCFGEGQYSGRFFTFRVDMTRESGDLVGKAVGIIE